MGFFVGFVLVFGSINIARWVRSHTFHEIRWQECPICHGTGRSPGAGNAYRCMTCMGPGGWAVSSKRFVSTQSHNDRPL